jgi:hypothetical protein
MRVEFRRGGSRCAQLVSAVAIRSDRSRRDKDLSKNFWQHDDQFDLARQYHAGNVCDEKREIVLNQSPVRPLLRHRREWPVGFGELSPQFFRSWPRRPTLQHWRERRIADRGTKISVARSALSASVPHPARIGRCASAPQNPEASRSDLDQTSQ